MRPDNIRICPIHILIQLIKRPQSERRHNFVLLLHVHAAEIDRLRGEERFCRGSRPVCRIDLPQLLQRHAHTLCHCHATGERCVLRFVVLDPCRILCCIRGDALRRHPRHVHFVLKREGRVEEFEIILEFGIQFCLRLLRHGIEQDTGSSTRRIRQT